MLPFIFLYFVSLCSSQFLQVESAMDFNPFIWKPSEGFYAKKQEKLPMQKPRRRMSFPRRSPPQLAFHASPPQFPSFEMMEQPGEAPRMTGRVEQPHSRLFPRPSSAVPRMQDATNGPIIDPTAFFLRGGNIEQISQPRCSLVGCTGPLPNDSSINFENTPINSHADAACHQVMIPLNGCFGNKGYPIGMLCNICCDCTNELRQEMRKTFGYRHYRP